MIVRRVAAALVFAAAMWMAPPSTAAPTWTAPGTITGFGAFAVFAIGTDGTQYVAWIDVTMPVDVHNVSTRLVVSHKRPGGAWEEEFALASTASAVPAALKFALAANGAAVIAFVEGTTNDFMPPPPLRWRALYRGADGVWEAPATLFTDVMPTPTNLLFTPLCAIAPDGTAVAGAVHLEPDVSEPSPGQSDAKLDASFRTAAGPWQAVQQLSATDQSVDVDPAIGADDAGNFTIAWTSRFYEGVTTDTSDDRHTILVRRRLAGQAFWNTAEDITGSDSSKDPLLNPRNFAVGPDGRAVLAYQYPDTNGDYNVTAVTRSDSMHTFAGAEPLVTSMSSSSPMAAAVSPDGTAYVIYWYQGDVSSSSSHVGMVEQPRGGTWTSPTPVSPFDTDSSGGGIAFSSADAIAVWEFQKISVADTYAIQAVRWPGSALAPEGYQDVEPSTANQTLAQVLPDHAGGVLAIWSESGDPDLHYAAYDASGPVLMSSTIPSPLYAGVAASFAAGFTDLWSVVSGEPSWNFGDGTAGAGGGTVSHTFAAPGDYTITASALDSLGNVGTASFAVTVGVCESLSGLDALRCRCAAGPTVADCAGATLPTPLTKRFTKACAAVEAAATAGPGKKGRKAAGRAGRIFKSGRGSLASRAGRRLSTGCRSALTDVLDGARDSAVAFKGTL